MASTITVESGILMPPVIVLLGIRQTSRHAILQASTLAGEPVAVPLPNGLDFVRVRLGLMHLGTNVVALAEKELPRYAQPRFIEILPVLPKTPTGKVQKAALRGRGVAETTWDKSG